MGKVAFLPFSLGGGLLSGLIAKRIFARAWKLIDDEEAPQARHRQASLGKLVLALLVQGAIFSLAKGLVDHGSRHGFAALTGAWPGEEAPQRQD